MIGRYPLLSPSPALPEGRGSAGVHAGQAAVVPPKPAPGQHAIAKGTAVPATQA